MENKKEINELVESLIELTGGDVIDLKTFLKKGIAEEKKCRELNEDWDNRRKENDLIKERWSKIKGANLLLYLRANNKDIKRDGCAYYLVDKIANNYRFVWYNSSRSPFESARSPFLNRQI